MTQLLAGSIHPVEDLDHMDEILGAYMQSLHRTEAGHTNHLSFWSAVCVQTSPPPIITVASVSSFVRVCRVAWTSSEGTPTPGGRQTRTMKDMLAGLSAAECAESLVLHCVSFARLGLSLSVFSPFVIVAMGCPHAALKLTLKPQCRAPP